MQYNSALYNLFRNGEQILKAQEEISTGKRINSPSDDPVGMVDLLQIRRIIADDKQSLKTAEAAENIFNLSDSLLGDMYDRLSRAKELAIQADNSTYSENDRISTAAEIDSIIEEIVSLANRKHGDIYLFSGLDNRSEAVDANGEYVGSNTNFAYSLYGTDSIENVARGDKFLAADMNPALSSDTLLPTLKDGEGISSGSFTIQDREGNIATIDTASMNTVGDLLTAINGSGINIAASIDTDNGAILLEDSSSLILAPIEIININGDAATDLGLAGKRHSITFLGDSHNAKMENETLIIDLFDGKGLDLEEFEVVQGDLKAEISFNMTEVTVGDMLGSINNSLTAAGLNATASISSTGNRIVIEPNSTTDPIAISLDKSGGKITSSLGLGGATNIIPTLKLFSESLKQNDLTAINNSVGLINNAMTELSNVRTAVGAISNNLTQTITLLKDLELNNLTIQSKIEDADVVKSASDLALLENSYKATVQSMALIIDQSLVDFLS